jgi:hypothetical protein
MSLKSSPNLAALGLWWALRAKPALGEGGVKAGKFLLFTAILAGMAITVMLLLAFSGWGAALVQFLFEKTPFKDPDGHNLAVSLVVFLNHTSAHHPVLMGVVSAFCGLGGGGYLVWYLSLDSKSTRFRTWPWFTGAVFAFPAALFGSIWVLLGSIAIFLMALAAGFLWIVLFGLWGAARFIPQLPSVLKSRRDGLLAAHPEVQARVEHHNLDEKLKSAEVPASKSTRTRL